MRHSQRFLFLAALMFGSILGEEAGAQFLQQGTKLVGTGRDGIAVLQGSSVDVSGDGNIAIVGGYADHSGTGAAWVFTRSATSVREEAANVPSQFVLEQNYPNPFNPSTTIRYGLPHKTSVTLTVFSTLGQQVAVLQNGEQDAGYHQVEFEGSGLSSGVYFYRLRAGDFVETKRLLLIR